MHIETVTTRAEPILNADGVLRTSGRGGISGVTYDEMVRAFGEPHDRTQDGPWKSGDGKVRVEWAFRVQDQDDEVWTVTLYDYKDTLPLAGMNRWRIGGNRRGKDIARWVADVLCQAGIQVDAKRDDLGDLENWEITRTA